jgi:hypothetical protein
MIHPLEWRLAPLLLLAGALLGACADATAGEDTTAVAEPAGEYATAASAHAIHTAGPSDAGPSAVALAGAGVPMTVYQTPTCGCCGAWVDHVRENGFDVTVVMHNDLTPVRRSLGIPPEVTSCHMGVVQGFAVEGHVPAEAIHRLLLERPAVLGVAVPGMPIGSPGMEGPNPRPYQVIAIGHDGARTLFQTVDPR